MFTLWCNSYYLCAQTWSFCFKWRETFLIYRAVNGQPLSIELVYVTDVKVTSCVLKRSSIRLRICTSLRWQQQQVLNRNAAMSTWRLRTGNHRNNDGTVMSEIMHEPVSKSVPAFRNEDNDFRKPYKTSMGDKPYKLWHNSWIETPEIYNILGIKHVFVVRKKTDKLSLSSKIVTIFSIPKYNKISYELRLKSK